MLKSIDEQHSRWAFLNSPITTHSPDETIDWTIALAQQLQAGDILALVGDLGAGKTCIVQGIASAFHVPESTYVRSPTFTLVNEYAGQYMPLYHFDFYRLNHVDALMDIGFDDYCDSHGLCLVEWANLFPDAFPDHTLWIHIKIIDEYTRQIFVQKGFSHEL